MTLFKIIPQLTLMNGQNATNNFYVDVPGETGDGGNDLYTDLQSWCEAIYIAAQAAIPPGVAMTLMSIYVVNETDGKIRLVEQRVPTWVGAAASNNMMTGFVAARVYSLPTGQKDASSFYLPGIGKGATDSTGDLDSAYLPNLALAGLEWISSETGGNAGLFMQPVQWSPTKLAKYPLTGSAVVNTELDVMSSRKTGRGS